MSLFKTPYEKKNRANVDNHSGTGWTANAEWTEVNALELPDPGSINCLNIGIIL